MKKKKVNDAQKDNIVQYKKKRKKITINAAVVFFALVFLYLCIMIIRSFTQDSLSIYEVRKGRIYDYSSYSGIILRDESVYYTSQAGYVNYYIRDKQKVSVNNLIYTVDKDGEFSKFLENSIQQGDISLSEEDLKSLKGDISGYMKSFSAENFDSVYNISSDIKNNLHIYIDDKLISSDIIASTKPVTTLVEKKSDLSGIITYYVDGYEDLTIDKINSKYFSKTNYTKTNLSNGKELALWDPAYKIIKSDDWSIIFKPDKTDLTLLSEIKKVTIKFLYNDITTDADITLFNGADGNVYAELDMNRYLIDFISDRFVDFEICFENSEGLKIPKTSVVKKNVLKIPIQYAASSGSAQTLGFMKETVGEDGAPTIAFVTGTIYKEDDFYYYLECRDLAIGDVLVKQGVANDRYEVCLEETIDGVFTVNKGYASFRRINIIGEKEDYYIVKEGIRKGIARYDHIALRGSEISENQIIY
ncbi:MAG: hypothetical protein IJM37_04090 [Lachnospiraceae bacterium]|nr:hypothetical protein [Lachnospiraceae bacterium]